MLAALPHKARANFVRANLSNRATSARALQPSRKQAGVEQRGRGAGRRRRGEPVGARDGLRDACAGEGPGAALRARGRASRGVGRG
eukprot:126411-Rhodomonas_salina.1